MTGLREQDSGRLELKHCRTNREKTTARRLESKRGSEENEESRGDTKSRKKKQQPQP